MKCGFFVGSIYLKDPPWIFWPFWALGNTVFMSVSPFVCISWCTTTYMHTCITIFIQLKSITLLHLWVENKQIYAQSWQCCFNDILQDWSLLKQLLTKLDQLIFKWRVHVTCSSGIHVEGQVLNLSLNSELIKASHNPTYHDLCANPA